LVTVQVPIDWAQRARNIAGPESALSAIVTFKAAGANQSDVTLAADRNTTPAAYTMSYPTPSQAAVGIHAVSITFYSLPSGSGSAVGTALAELDVLPNGTLADADGTPLGAITAIGTVESVVVESPTVSVGQATAIETNAYDNNRNLVVVSPGSIGYAITQGTGSASITAAGQIQGVTAGTVTLQATIDGISSPSVSVTVMPPSLPVTTIPQPTNAMLIDTQSGHLWASVPGTDPAYGNSVIEIDPSTGKILSSVAVGSNPGPLAISADDDYLYVGLQGAEQIVKVDLNARSAVSTIAIVPDITNQTAYASGIAVDPGDDNTIAVSQQNGTYATTTGVIYSNGQRLGQDFGNFSGLTLGFSGPNLLWISGPGPFPPGLFEYSVGANGATQVKENGALGGNFKVFGGNLYFTNGQVVSSTTAQLTGTYTALINSLSDVTVDLAAGRAFLIGAQYNGNLQLYTFGVSSYKLLDSVQLPVNYAQTFFGLSRWGATGLAFADGSNIYLIAKAPGL